MEKININTKKVLIFSPHLDDAILSMGNLIAHLAILKKEIYVYNIFTQGSSLSTALTQKLLKQAGYSDAKTYFLERKKEDKRAFEDLGRIHIYNLDFVDAVWRTDETIEPLYPTTTWNISMNERDIELKQRLKNRLSSLITFKEEITAFAPVGKGKEHIDHILVRDVAFEMFPQMIFYSDFSYGQNFTEEPAFVIKHRLKPASLSYGRDHSKKLKAVLHHKSQIKGLFAGNKPIFPPEVFYVQSPIYTPAV